MQCDILVVGLGPVGSALSVLAHLHGLTVVAIDRDEEVHPLPRAAGFDHEAMRNFQMMGIADECEAQCRILDRCQFVTAQNEILLDFSTGEIGPSGWAGGYALHQPAVESALRRRMEELGIETRLGTQLRAFEQTSDHVTATIVQGGQTSTINARYLVGCDGSRSFVRDRLGQGLDDYDFNEPWLVVDLIVDEKAGLPKEFRQICDPARPLTYLWIGGNRFRWEFMLRKGETPEEMLTEERIRALLAPWNCVDLSIVERKAVYTFHGLVAKHWRERRVFLAGDAAHQMPPFAGQGMCSGIRDAVNLAWKLALVVHEQADSAILDTYQSERDPHVRAIIERAIHMGRIVCMQDPVAAKARDAEMLARQRSGEIDPPAGYPDLLKGFLTDTPHAGALFIQPIAPDGTRFDRCLGTRPVLIGGDLADCRAEGIDKIDISSSKFADFAQPLSKWLADVPSRAVLVRPDRHIFGTGDPDDLIAAWRRAAWPKADNVEAIRRPAAAGPVQ